MNNNTKENKGIDNQIPIITEMNFSYSSGNAGGSISPSYGFIVTKNTYLYNSEVEYYNQTVGEFDRLMNAFLDSTMVNGVCTMREFFNFKYTNNIEKINWIHSKGKAIKLALGRDYPGDINFIGSDFNVSLSVHDPIQYDGKFLSELQEFVIQKGAKSEQIGDGSNFSYAKIESDFLKITQVSYGSVSGGTAGGSIDPKLARPKLTKKIVYDVNSDSNQINVLEFDKIIQEMLDSTRVNDLVSLREYIYYLNSNNNDQLKRIHDKNVHRNQPTGGNPPLPLVFANENGTVFSLEPYSEIQLSGVGVSEVRRFVGKNGTVSESTSYEGLHIEKQKPKKVDYSPIIKQTLAGVWSNDVITINISQSLIQIDYHGQCTYSYLARAIQDDKIQMLWSDKGDCSLNLGFDKHFGLDKYPEILYVFAEFTLLENGMLKANYMYPEWIKAYSEQVKKGVFTEEFRLIKKEN